MRKISKAGLGALGALALVLAPLTPAHADHAAEPTDIVIIGSDTVQYVMDFATDGDYNGNPGVNAAGARFITFDATGDANGKLTTGATAVERAGTFPVTRQNGSGAGLTYLTQTDTAGPTAQHRVQYVRSSRPTNQGEKDAAVALQWGGLHCYQLGIDGLQMAVSNLTPTNAPAGGITTAQLQAIYSNPAIRTWRQAGITTNGNPDANIIAIVPQVGSGTRSFFESSIGVTEAQILANPNLVVSEEHDAAPVQSTANAIAPFSTARNFMLNQGYFNNGTAQTPVVLQSGGTAFSVTRPIFLVVRQSDVASAFNTKLVAFLSGPNFGPLRDSAGFTGSFRDAGTACS